MTRIVLALRRNADIFTDDLEAEGATVIARLHPDELAEPGALPRNAEVLILSAERRLLTPELLNECDASGIRILLIGGGEAEQRLAHRRGLHAPLPADATAWDCLDALHATEPDSDDAPSAPEQGRVIAVWGPHGAPGASTVAVQLAAELASRSRHVALVDANTHAPALSLLLGLTDDGPGIAAACRRAELGTLDREELVRLAEPYPTDRGVIDVLIGLNRPSRWPELSPTRLKSTLALCRTWADDTIVDVASSLEADEELMSDIDVPRRNAATRTVLADADHVVAVVSADPLGMSRFIRDHAELRALIGPTPLTVVVNRLRPGPLGLDARGQVRRSLERFAGVRDVHFLPDDPRAVDAAILHARPPGDAMPRSSFAAAISRTTALLVNDTASPSTRRRAEPEPPRRERGRRAKNSKRSRARKRVTAG